MQEPLANLESACLVSAAEARRTGFSAASQDAERRARLRIRLDLADDELRQRCLSALAGMAQIVPQGDGSAELPPVDIVLADHCSPHAPGEDGDANLARDVACPQAAPATIAIGVEAPCDLALPRDCTARELQQACALLAEIVRLRRQLAVLTSLPQTQSSEALLDPLTGCPNRRAWEHELKARFAAAQAGGPSLCVALFDLDFLKQVNAGWGHVAGDQLLQATAQALRDSLRQADFVARLGGDEFGALLSGLSREESASVVQRVRGGLPARMARMTSKVASVSVGYARYEGQPGVTLSTLVAAADQALLKAKQQGRDAAVPGG
jgi:diguanylate cyclase (GGDEF)-like protein